MRKSRYTVDLAFRSGLEVAINKQLVRSGCSFSYEGDLNAIRYLLPESRHRYLCDFLLSNGVMIEAKGLFTAKDRQKHLHIRNQHPQLDIRFVFSRANSRLSKKSSTTYKMWCTKNNFLWADRLVPAAWINEVRDERELALIITTLQGMNGR